MAQSWKYKYQDHEIEARNRVSRVELFIDGELADSKKTIMEDAAELHAELEGQTIVANILSAGEVECVLTIDGEAQTPYNLKDGNRGFTTTDEKLARLRAYSWLPLIYGGILLIVQILNLILKFDPVTASTIAALAETAALCATGLLCRVAAKDRGKLKTLLVVTLITELLSLAHFVLDLIFHEDGIHSLGIVGLLVCVFILTQISAIRNSEKAGL